MAETKCKFGSRAMLHEFVNNRTMPLVTDIFGNYKPIRDEHGNPIMLDRAMVKAVTHAAKYGGSVSKDALAVVWMMRHLGWPQLSATRSA